MIATTLHLRFVDRAAALAALAPLGFVGADLDTGEATIASTAWPDGVRADLALIGGDGTYRHQTGTTTVEIDGLGSIELPVISTVTGFHVDLLWSDGVTPDLGAARIYPETPAHAFAA